MSVDTSTHLTPSKQSKHHFHQSQNSLNTTTASNVPVITKLQPAPASITNGRRVATATALTFNIEDFKPVCSFLILKNSLQNFFSDKEN